jgi:hypothetical protein
MGEKKGRQTYEFLSSSSAAEAAAAAAAMASFSWLMVASTRVSLTGKYVSRTSGIVAGVPGVLDVKVLPLVL